jgi:hypothetical protein
MRVATAIDIEKAPQTLVDNHAVDKKNAAAESRLNDFRDRALPLLRMRDGNGNGILRSNDRRDERACCSSSPRSVQNPNNKKRRLPKEAAFFDLIS